MACVGGHTEIVELLLNNGATVNHTNNQKVSLLIIITLLLLPF